MSKKNTIAEGSRISIVDDDESMREAIKTLIGSVGEMSIEEFSSGEDFLNSGQSPVDCLILDVRMPGLSGLELQRRLLAENRPLPIVFITAHYVEQERKKAMEGGAVAYLIKPFTEQDLLTAINTSLAPDKRLTEGFGEELD